MSELVPLDQITRRIFLLRGQKVMLSTDLAPLYDVEPKALMQAVRRNLEGFPEDLISKAAPTGFNADLPIPTVVPV